MADSEALKVDGKNLSDLRVVDLKRELEKRGLSKSGRRKELLERLKSQLKLERMREEALQGAGQAPTIQLKDEDQSEAVRRYMAERDDLYKLQITQKRRIEEPEEDEKTEEPAIEEKVVEEEKVEVEDSSPPKKMKVDPENEGTRKRLTRTAMEKIRKNRRQDTSSSESEDDTSERKKRKKENSHRRKPSKHVSSSSSSTSSSSEDSGSATQQSSSSEEEVKMEKRRHQATEKEVEKPRIQKEEPAVAEDNSNGKDEPTSSPERIVADKDDSDRDEDMKEPDTTVDKKVEENEQTPKEESEKSPEIVAMETKEHETEDKNMPSSETLPTEVTSPQVTAPKETIPEVKEPEVIQEIKSHSRSRSSSQSPTPIRKRDSSDSSSRSRSPKRPSRSSRHRSSSSSSSRSRSASSDSNSSNSSRSDSEERSKKSIKKTEQAETAISRSRERSESPFPAKSNTNMDTSPPQKSMHDESFHTAPEDNITPAKPRSSRTEESVVEAGDKYPSKSTEAEKIDESNKVIVDNKKDVQPKPKPQRTRRWGQTRTQSRKPVMAISTDSLKGIIEIKPNAIKAEPVLDLSPEEGCLSTSSSEEEEEEEKQEVKEEEVKKKVKVEVVAEEKQEEVKKKVKVEVVDTNQEKEEETKQITRTISQNVSKDADEEMSDEEKEEAEQAVTMHDETTEVAMDTEQDDKAPQEQDSKKEQTVRRISRGGAERREPLLAVNLTAEEPEVVRRSPSPPRNTKNSIIHVANLVRPYTLNQLKELLGRTGTLVADGFWIDKIKSHCYASFENADQAEKTRNALHGTRWPSSNPKILRVDFTTKEQLDYYKNGEKVVKPLAPAKQVSREEKVIEKLMKTEPRQQKVDREQEGTREIKLKEKPKPDPPIREWDRHKLRQSRSRSPIARSQRERERDRDRRRSPERSRAQEHRNRDKDRNDKEAGGRSRERRRDSREKTEKKDKESDPAAPQEEEQSVKLLDELFHKTKATPCIYWLPLTQEQIVERDQRRKTRKEQIEKSRLEAEKNREAARQEREKERNERRKRSPRRSSERSSRRSRDNDDRGNRRR